MEEGGSTSNSNSSMTRTKSSSVIGEYEEDDEDNDVIEEHHQSPSVVSRWPRLNKTNSKMNVTTTTTTLKGGNETSNGPSPRRLSSATNHNHNHHNSNNPNLQSGGTPNVSSARGPSTAENLRQGLNTFAAILSPLDIVSFGLFNTPTNMLGDLDLDSVDVGNKNTSLAEQMKQTFGGLITKSKNAFNADNPMEQEASEDDEDGEEEEEEEEEEDLDIEGDSPDESQECSSSTGTATKKKSKKKRRKQRTTRRTKKMIKDRDNIIREILATEESYIEALETLIKVYKAPLKQTLNTNNPLASKSEIKQIFSNVSRVLVTNRALLRELHQCIDNYKDSSSSSSSASASSAKNGNTAVDVCDSIGQAFLHMSSYFKIYTLYCTHYNSAMTVLIGLKNSNPAFDKFLRHTRSEHNKQHHNLLNLNTITTNLITNPGTSLTNITSNNNISASTPTRATSSDLSHGAPNSNRNYSPTSPNLSNNNHNSNNTNVDLNNMVDNTGVNSNNTAANNIHHVNLNALDIESYLIMPIQRIPRYVLLLKQLKQHSINTTDLDEAIKRYEELADYVNESIRQAEHFRQMIHLQKLFGRQIRILNPTRKLLMQGELTKITSTHIIPHTLFFLFSDLIIYGFARSPSGIMLKGVIPLSTTWIRSLTDTAHVQNAFQIVGRKKTWTVYAESKVSKEKWVTAMRSRVDDIVKEREELKNERGEVSVKEPSWYNKIFTWSVEDYDEEEKGKEEREEQKRKRKEEREKKVKWNQQDVEIGESEEDERREEDEDEKGFAWDAEVGYVVKGAERLGLEDYVVQMEEGVEWRRVRGRFCNRCCCNCLLWFLFSWHCDYCLVVK